MEMSVRPGLLLLTADDLLLDHTLAVCAAAGIEPEVVADAGAAREQWARATLVMVGADQTDGVVQLGLARRSQILLLGLDDGRDLTGASLRLGAPIVQLPDGAAELVDTLTGLAGRPRDCGRVVLVLGGSGGVGASTMAAALAFVAARSGRRAAVIDLDPMGGGIDLLVGAERLPGWRWPRLSSARGQLGDLSGQLPHLDGVDLVAMGRGLGRAQEVPSDHAVAAVLSSTARSHDLIVLDVGRGVGISRATLALADVGLLLVTGDVRGVSAGRETYVRLGSAHPASEHLSAGATWHLLVRRPRCGGLNPNDAADGFDPPLLGSLDDDPAVAIAAERGEPPARPARGPLARLCRHVLDTAVWPDAVAA